jgi:arginine decarboxylase
MRIHVASGVGRGPTETAAYDAALAAAGVHNYNLVVVSSVVPAEASVVEVERVPDRGPPGGRLTVVEARATAGTGPLAAALAWATGPGPGLFYEAGGTGADEAWDGGGDADGGADAGADADAVVDAVRAEALAGLAAGRDLRADEWTFTDERVRVERADADATPDAHAAVVVVAAYGEAEPW